MSEDNIIAGVSDTLTSLLKDRMNQRVNVTLALPDFKAIPVDDSKDGRINLFLYKITENTSLKNEDLPGKGHPSSYGHPPLCLDLHYLLTAFGKLEDDIPGAQENLGEAMRIFHENPIITDQLLMINDNEPHRPIIDSRFKGLFEPLKIYLVPMGLDDISKLWTALTLPYRPSVAYTVSLVQIEDKKERRLPRAVGEPPPAGPRLYVVPLSVPQIREILVHRQGDMQGIERPYHYARIGDNLILRGSGFGGSSIRVILGSVEAKIISQKDNRLEVEVPDDSELLPGPQPVRVLRDIEMGEPPTSHTGFTSNQSVFMLVPHISQCTLISPRTLRIIGSRLFSGKLPGETLVGRMVAKKYELSSENEINIRITDAFPASSAKCLLSGKLNPFPILTDNLELVATCGLDGPHTFVLEGKPGDIKDAAIKMQRSFHSAPKDSTKPGPAFKNLQIAIIGDNLLLVPGGRDDKDTIHFGITPTANDLQLLVSPTGAAEKSAYISGGLSPFPRISAAFPSVSMKVGSATQTIKLDDRPATLEQAAVIFQKAIRAAGYPGAFVTTLGDQILIMLDDVNFDSVPGVDERSIAEFQLRASYPVRVRVNGAESIDESFVTIPWSP